MLLITPHTTFYNWSMLSVAFVLLLYADVRPRWLAPSLIAMMAIAAAATRAATPWPLPLDRYRPAGTLGIYWIQPGGPSRDLRDRIRPVFVWPELLARAPSAVSMTVACLAAAVAGYGVSAYVSGSGPFRSDAHFSRTRVLRALPEDFPAPADAALRDAGRGGHLPYRIEWAAKAPVSEVAGVMRRRLDDGAWTIVAPADDGDAATIDLRSARAGADAAPIIAELTIAPDGDGSTVRLEFSPLPASAVPGYDEWLEGIGLVVHDVDRSLIETPK